MPTEAEKLFGMTEQQPEKTIAEEAFGIAPIEPEEKTGKDRAIELGENFLRGTKEGLSVLGYMGDMSNTLLERSLPAQAYEKLTNNEVEGPLLESEDIQRYAEAVLNSVGIETKDAEAGDWMGNIAQISGASIVPMGALYKLGQLKNAPKWLKNITESPKTFLGIEGIAVGTAATERTLMEQAFPENAEVAGLIGELLSIPTMIGLPAAYNTGNRIYSKAKNVFSKDKALDRAADEIQGYVKDPQKAAKTLDEFGDSPVAPAQQSGDEGLLQAYRNYAGRDPGYHLMNEEEVITRLTRDLDEALGGGNSSVYVDRAKDSIRETVRAIDDSVEAAATEAQRALDDLPNPRPEQVSRVTHAKIDEKYSNLKQQESKIWNNLNTDAKVADANEISNTVSAMEDLIQQGQNARKVPKDMMDLVKGFLFENQRFLNSRMQVTLNDNVTIKTLQNLRSRLLDEMAEAASGPKPDRNRVALLGELQEALLEDMANIPEVSDDIAKARAYSYALNNRYNKGPVGRLRGTAADGSLRTDPDLTLNKLVAKGERGGVNIRALIDPEYTSTGKVPKGYKGAMAQTAERSEETMSAISDYMSALFLASTKRSGAFNPDRGVQFLDDYKQILDNFPSLRAKLQNAIEKGNASQIKAKGAKIDLDQVQKTKIATLLNVDDPKTVVQRIRTSDSPSRELKAAVDAVDGDPDALAGLRTLIYEEARNTIVTSREIGTTGLKEISRAKAEKVFSPEYKRALQETGVLDGQQIEALEYFMKQLNAHMRYVDAKVPGTSGTSQDILSYLAKLSVLKWAVPATGIKGPGQLSFAQAMGSRTEKFVKNLGTDTTENLVKRALMGSRPEDKELLKLLLSKVSSREEELKKINKLRTYLLTTYERYDSEDDTPVEKKAQQINQ